MNILNPIHAHQQSTALVFEQNVPLADKNWFKTGGQTRYFCEPATEQEFLDAVIFAKNNNLEMFILGEGANILISDEGFDGLTIRPKLQNISILKKEGGAALVSAQAGVRFESLIDFCLKNNLLGLEEFSGIPGTVGGSVYINIHFFEFLLSQFLINARVIDVQQQSIMNVDNAWFEFGYDQSKLFNNNYYLVEATFKLSCATDIDTAYAQGRRFEMTRLRNSRYPTSNTCGSFFRNFHDHEVTLEVNNKKMTFVAYYLDKLGIKGALKVGNCIVSHQHANMFVTQPGATSQDVINLVQTIQKMVLKEYGIVPKAECQLIGFKNNPLL